MIDLSQGFSRRKFIAQTSCFGAFYAVAKLIPLPSVAETIGVDSRVSPTPLVDKGFASVRKIGNGLYATISDPSKGNSTLCNGGFLVGKDAALLVEGFTTPAGASFQMDVLRTVSQAPVKGAVDTHYHFDHSMGNAFYGANGVPLWAHATASKRIVESYAPMQGADKAAVLGPFEKRVADAKSDTERQHAQSDLNAVTGVFQFANSTILALPNHPLDPAKLPMKIDLGGLTATLESYPGHSGTDIVVRALDQNVVYTGDLLFNGWYPVCLDEKATISGWRATLAKLAAFDKDTLFVPGMDKSAGKKASPASAKYSTISPHRPRKCSRPACLPKKRNIVMSCQINSRTSPFSPGDSPSARQSQNCMPNGNPSNSFAPGDVSICRETASL